MSKIKIHLSADKITEEKDYDFYDRQTALSTLKQRGGKSKFLKQWTESQEHEDSIKRSKIYVISTEDRIE